MTRKSGVHPMIRQGNSRKILSFLCLGAYAWVSASYAIEGTGDYSPARSAPKTRRLATPGGDNRVYFEEKNYWSEEFVSCLVDR